MTPFGQIKAVHFSSSTATLPFSHLVAMEKPMLPLTFFPLEALNTVLEFFLECQD